MLITIKRKILPENKELYKDKWDLQMQKSYRFVITYCTAGVAFVSFGFFFMDKDHFVIDFGAVFIGVGLLYLYRIYNARKKWFRALGQMLQKAYAENKEITITIDNTGINYQEPNSSQQLQWAAFSKYKLYKSDLYLLTGNDYLSSYVVYGNEISEHDFKELQSFLSETLSKK